TQGGSLGVAIGETGVTDTPFTPEIVVYGPAGDQLGFNFSGIGSNVFLSNLTTTGTYTLARFDCPSTPTGTYALTPVAAPRTPLPDSDSVLVSPCQYRPAPIYRVDMDPSLIRATQGGSLGVAIGETGGTDTAFTPEIVVYGPAGDQLGFNFSGLGANLF